VDLIQDGLSRGVSSEEVKQYALKIGAKVYETSSKNGLSIDNLFQDIAEDYILKTEGLLPSAQNSFVKPDEKKEISSGGRCCG